mmetsp:Transcript_117199/g.213235  ORF Transcript_117199/g.213235 Transcript_117199/m.213235 type:complete len:262 (+) Transcript_117199:159-944(+)
MEISQYISWLTSDDEGGTTGNSKSSKDKPYPLRVPGERDQADLLRQYSLLLEYERLQDVLPSGMYVLPSYDSLHTWHGVIFPRQGLYRGGSFKFELELPADYPDSPPSLRLLDDIFHPMVEPETGRFDLGSIFPEWRAGRDYAACVLPHLHRALLRREYFSNSARSPLNPEARELFVTSPPQFAERAADCARRSVSNSGIDGTSRSALDFSKTPTEAHELLLRALHGEEASASNNAEASPDERKTAFTAWFCDHYGKGGDL